MENRSENNRQNKEIDIEEILKKLWTYRFLYVKILGVVFVLSCFCVISIPRTYNTTVTLAPETESSSSLSGSMSSIASMMGVRVGNSSDAIYPELYPDILESSPFLIELFDVNVEYDDGKSATYYKYMLKHQKHPWWHYVFSPIRKFFKKLIGKSSTMSEGVSLNSFCLTKEQKDVMEIMKKRISCSVDKKTDVITITAIDQNPYISACLADTVCRKLQDYIVRYRTNKARVDYEYMDRLFQTAKKEYLDAQKKYVRFSDANQNLKLLKYKAQEELLQKEMEMAYNAYQQLSEQLQLARAKVQESTPAFTMIQPAIVPLKPAAPKRMLIVLGTMFVAFIMSSCWFLFFKK